MCDPVTLAAASFAVTTVSTIGSTVMQAQQASAEAEYRDAQIAQSHQAAVENYDLLQLRREQEREAASQQVEANQREALRATERARTAAGEAGVTGLSVDALLGDLYGQEARFRNNVAVNLEAVNSDIDQSASDVRTGTINQITSLPQISRPDYFGAGARLAGAGFSSYRSAFKV